MPQYSHWSNNDTTDSGSEMGVSSFHPASTPTRFAFVPSVNAIVVGHRCGHEISAGKKKVGLTSPSMSIEVRWVSGASVGFRHLWSPSLVSVYGHRPLPAYPSQLPIALTLLRIAYITAILEKVKYVRKLQVYNGFFH